MRIADVCFQACPMSPISAFGGMPDVSDIGVVCRRPSNPIMQTEACLPMRRMRSDDSPKI